MSKNLVKYKVYLDILDGVDTESKKCVTEYTEGEYIHE